MIEPHDHLVVEGKEREWSKDIPSHIPPRIMSTGWYPAVKVGNAGAGTNLAIEVGRNGFAFECIWLEMKNSSLSFPLTGSENVLGHVISVCLYLGL